MLCCRNPAVAVESEKDRRSAVLRHEQSSPNLASAITAISWLFMTDFEFLIRQIWHCCTDGTKMLVFP